MTINEIAKMAGVSSAAVSRYLNNGYLSEDKKEQIRKVIEETNYQPSLQAQMLRTKKTRLILTLIDSNTDEECYLLLNEVVKSLSSSGYDMLLSITGESNSDTVSVARGADGIVYISTEPNDSTIKMLSGQKLPVVLCGCEMNGFISVSEDYKTAAEEITSDILSQGKCKIAYIGLVPKNRNRGAKLFEGYKNALVNKGTAMDAKLIKLCGNSIQAGYDSAKELFSISDGIDAVFCNTDIQAAGVYKYLAKNPAKRDVALSGFGSSPISEICFPPIITRTIDYKKIASDTTELLLKNL